MNRFLLASLALSLTLAGCSKDDDSGAAGGTDGTDGTSSDGTSSDGADGTGGTDGTGGGSGITLEGTSVMMFDQSTPAAEGLCVDILDPTNVLTGGEAVVVSSTTVGAGGAWTATEVPIVSLGLFALVRDCDDSGSTTFPSATGIPSSSYSDSADGDTVSGVASLVLSADDGAGFQASLAAVGFSGEIATAGVVTGFILEADGSAGVEGATMTCGSCSVYYGDSDPADGLFSTAGAPNGAASAAAGGLFAVPDAELTTYQPLADGYEFNSSPLAALPAMAVIAAFYDTSR